MSRILEKKSNPTNFEFLAEKRQKGSLQKLQKTVHTLKNFMDLPLRSNFFPSISKAVIW